LVDFTVLGMRVEMESERKEWERWEDLWRVFPDGESPSDLSRMQSNGYTVKAPEERPIQ
jgi:hypothetical protein